MSQQIPDAAQSELLRELLNRGPQATNWFTNRKGPAQDPLGQELGGRLLSGWNPPVAPPPMFRPDTDSGPDPNVANMLESIFKAAPNLRGRVSRLQVGPNRPATEILNQNGIRSNEYEQSNLNGVWDRGTSSISLNPAMMDPRAKDFFQSLTGSPFARGYKPESTLLHEFGHSQGYKHVDPEMKQLEDMGLSMNLYDPQRPWTSWKRGTR